MSMQYSKPRYKLIRVSALLPGYVFGIPGNASRALFAFQGFVPKFLFMGKNIGKRAVYVTVIDGQEGNVFPLVLGPYVAVRIAEC